MPEKQAKNGNLSPFVENPKLLEYNEKKLMETEQADALRAVKIDE